MIALINTVYKAYIILLLIVIIISLKLIIIKVGVKVLNKSLYAISNS